MFVINRYYFVLLYFCVSTASIARSKNNHCSEFRCNSGECIDGSFICDGSLECEDSSDETEALCSKITCPSRTFRCNYGACISRKARCDGILDCADGSDESPSFCGTHAIISASPPERSCEIPENIANGKYALNFQPEDQSYASNVSMLIVNCDEGYNNDPPETFYSICRNGVWIPRPPTCSQSCSSLAKWKYPRVRCEHKGISLRSCDNPIDGVKATGACFENREAENCAYLCSNGNWIPVSSDK